MNAKNTIKRPYYNEEAKMWAVERFQAEGDMPGKHTVYDATEADAERNFIFWVKRGYEIVETVALPASITEPVALPEPITAEPGKQTEDNQKIVRRDIAEKLDGLSLGAQRIVFDNYRCPYGHDIREIGERAKYVHEIVQKGLAEITPQKIFFKQEVCDLLVKIL